MATTRERAAQLSAHRPRWQSNVNPLLPSQVEVLRYLAEGYDAHEIAKLLFITPSAVRMRLIRAGVRMQTRTPIQTVVEADRQGWLDYSVDDALGA